MTGFPAYFDEAPTVRVRDPLAQLLGASGEGVLEYRYADAVRLDGHSCPTVAAAFLTGRAALTALYPNTLPERGGVAVHLPAPKDEGTTGVVAQFLTRLTGAAADGGFRGIGGCFERRDTGAAVAVRFDANTVAVDPAQRRRMSAVANHRADAAQPTAFADAWPVRVQHFLMEHADDPATVRVTRLFAGGGAA